MKSKKPTLRFYEYAGCSTCRKAQKFLDARGESYERIPIVDQPPSASELKRMAGFLEGGFRKLFNTSGQRYRELGMSAKMDQLTLDEAVRLLSQEGKLIKRPFLLSSSGGAVGFDPKAWQALLD